MMMEIVLDEKKAQQYNIDILKCYESVDDYFLKRGVKKLKQGKYFGTHKDFSTFSIAQVTLPDTNWFLKIVDQWYCWYEGDSEEYREDALTIYYKVQKRYANFKESY